MDETNKSLRGDATRQALLAAATRVFARHGYDAASSRMLADAAGVNQALIGYHFGGKHGLYLAVFEAMAAEVGGRLLPVAAEIAADIEAAEASPETAAERGVRGIVRLLHALADVFLRDDTADWARLVLREQQEPSDAFELLYDGPMKRMLDTMTRLVALASQGDQRIDPGIVALTLASQVMVFRMAHAAALRHLGWNDGMGGDEIRRIKEQIAMNVRARFAPGAGS